MNQLTVMARECCAILTHKCAILAGVRATTPAGSHTAWHPNGRGVRVSSLLGAVCEYRDVQGWMGVAGEDRRHRSGSALFAGLLLVLLAALTFGSPDARAQVTYHYEHADSLTTRGALNALSDSPFGEITSYIDGANSFSVTDVEAKTQAALPLRFGRSWAPFAHKFSQDPNGTGNASEVHDAEVQFEVLGVEWAPDIPSLTGLYLEAEGLMTGARARCSGGSVVPGTIAVQGNPPIMAYNFWHGFSANIPGYGSGKIQSVNASTVLPTDGSTYKFATLNGWRVSCLTALKNGTGEGYLVILPDGAKYYFDWIATRPVTPFMAPYTGVWKRHELVFLATKAVDRFGNTITYSYDPSRPNRLMKISAFDGAEIVISYNADGQISEVATGDKVWRYNYRPYGTGPRRSLTEVVRPDGSKWKFEGPEYVYGDTSFVKPFGEHCDYKPYKYTSSGDRPVVRIRMTHPSGLVGEFFYKGIAHGYNNTSLSSCNTDGSESTTFIGRPKAFVLPSLISKKLYGPGVATKEWTITYAPSWSYENECANGCPNTSTTIVAGPDGRIDTYVYGNDFQVNANQLLSHSVSDDGVLLRKIDYSYMASLSGQPFSDYIAGPLGEEVAATLDNPFLRRNRPLVETSIYQDGLVLKAKNLQFDYLARPTSVTKSSAAAP